MTVKKLKRLLRVSRSSEVVVRGQNGDRPILTAIYTIDERNKLTVILVGDSATNK